MVSRRGWQDVRPPVMRFEYMDRMDEDEAEQGAAARREQEDRALLRQKIEPNRVLSVGGKRVGVYQGERALAMAGLRGAAR